MCIQNPVKHLRRSFLQKQLTVKPSTIFEIYIYIYKYKIGIRYTDVRYTGIFMYGTHC